MSTKTTFKRVALVTVAALGFGLLSSTAPASAYAASMSTIPSLTVVGTTAGYGYIPVTLTADGTSGNQRLDSTESLTATVIANPTALDSTTAASDLQFSLAKRTAVNVWAAATDAARTAPADNAGSFWIQGGNDAEASITNPARPSRLGTYWLLVKPATNSKAIDKGTYTVRIRLTDSNGFITSTNVSVNFVSSAADSGATITVTATGAIRTGESVTIDADRSIRATLTNGTTGGRVQLARASADLSNGPGRPVLQAQTLTGTGVGTVADAVSEFSVTDTGTQVTSAAVTGDFYSATATDSATAWTEFANGVYGVTAGTAQAWALTSTDVSPRIRLFYGSASTTAALTILNAAAQTATPVVTFSGAGALTASTPFNLPLTTKTATFTVTGATPGNAYQYYVAWSKVAVADATPADSTWTTVFADATGAITAPISNGNPVDGAVATVSFRGFTSAVTDQVVNWVRSKPAAISVDNGGAYVALKSTTVFTATVTDAFGAPVSGVLLQPALSATSSNYTAAGRPTVLTNASGQATFSLTDAAAVAAGTDVVSFTMVDGTALTGTASATITYAATAPAVTAMSAFYARQPSTAATAIVTAVPAGGIYADMSNGTRFLVVDGRNTAIANAAADNQDQLAVRISTGAIGARVVATASAGAYILSSANFQTSTRTFFTGLTGHTDKIVIGSNKTGANTVTFTSGTVSTTVAFWVGNASGDARNITLTQAAAGSPVVVTVTDRYGNGVANKNIQVATSAGTLGNGQMTTVYTTDLDGKINVVPVGSEPATITATATTTDHFYDAAGFVGTSAVNADLKAGNATATLLVTPAASAVDVAQAATDAAAEATDAANAATDAANAAAEAADAATAAAQDAADAVAALSTQVTELVSALRKQITSLTNLVIKIQKKVRA